MAIPVIMPRQGQSVESCIITEWKKKVGDTVNEGDVLFTYETDKSSFEEPAKVGGTLLAVFFNADDDVPCLTNVAVIGNPGEAFAEFDPAAGGAGAAASAAAGAPAAPEAVKEAAPAAVAEATAARATGVSPRARAAAEKLHIDVAAAAPTGPHGRVIERDVLLAAKEGRTGTGLGGRVTEADRAVSPAPAAAQAAAPAAADVAFEDVKMPNLRKIIGRAMHDSLAEMAQLTHSTSFDATQLMALRASIKAAPESMELPKITINDVILYAVSRVLPHYKDLNANCLGDTMRYYTHVNLGIAVDTPRGLLVPTLMAADTKSLREISIESKQLINAAKEGSINPDLLKNASFTVSNLGVYGIESFTPVVNPPQTGILGVCCAVDRVRKAADGSLSVYPAMGLSLTYDHRAVDGAPASRFLKELVTALENLNVLLVG